MLIKKCIEEYNNIEKQRLQYIIDLGLDCDGYDTVESLKLLINEIVDIAKGNQDEVVREIYDL